MNGSSFGVPIICSRGYANVPESNQRTALIKIPLLINTEQGSVSIDLRHPTPPTAKKSYIASNATMRKSPDGQN